MTPSLPDVAVQFQSRLGNIGAASIQRMAHFALRQQGMRKAMLSIVIMDDDDIREVNRAFLRHDYPTDIITFPLEESPLEAELLIGAGVLRRQAGEYGVPVGTELARLIIHGVLHLTGFDDRDEASRTRMKAREDELLEMFLALDRKSA